MKSTKLHSTLATENVRSTGFPSLDYGQRVFADVEEVEFDRRAARECASLSR